MTNLKSRLGTLVDITWYALRRPQLTGLLVGIVAVVLLLGVLIPQQNSPANTELARAAWIAGLPPLVQLWGTLLFFLGFSHLFQSVWFWLPLALLLLNSLLALADYGPGARQRLGSAVPSLDWQHPLARRGEYSTRLPEAPDKFLETLKTSLAGRGFFIYESGDAGPRILGAAQYRWAWLGPAMVYAGLVVLVLAFFISHYFFQVDRLTLWPLEPTSSPLFAETFVLAQTDGVSRSTVAYLPAEAGPITAMAPFAYTNLTWRLDQPALVEGVLVLPLALKPGLAVAAYDATGAPLKLIPSQQDLPPAERLHLSLDETHSPSYFLIPSVGLAFQLEPDSTSADTVKVKVRRDPELTSPQEFRVHLGQEFELDETTLTISAVHSLNIVAYYDPAFPVYLLGLILLVVGALLWGQIPRQVWLISEVKGRGGQLYGVVEKFGSVEDTPQFFETLLAAVLSPDITEAPKDQNDRDQ